MMEVLGAGMDDSPQVFMRKVQTESDVKALLNMHRLLHAWMAELRSTSPVKKFGKGGWTPRWIGPAHDLVVRRLTQLVPSFKHDSPIAAAIPYPPVKPLMLIPEYVSIVGSRVKEGKGPGEADLDVVVRDNAVNESLDVRLSKELGEGLHVIYDAHGPHDEAPFYEPLYHLVLIPVSEWRERRKKGLAAAMKAFNELVEPVRETEEYGHRVLLGAALVRAEVDGSLSNKDASEIGRDAAFWVYSNDPYPRDSVPFWRRELRATEFGLSRARSEAVRVFSDEMVPVDDLQTYEKGVDRVVCEVGRLVDEGVVDSRGALLVAARRIGREIAEEIKHE